jgi:hypothetical protein
LLPPDFDPLPLELLPLFLVPVDPLLLDLPLLVSFLVGMNFDPPLFITPATKGRQLHYSIREWQFVFPRIQKRWIFRGKSPHL